jgi:hypothetical protein
LFHDVELLLLHLKTAFGLFPFREREFLIQLGVEMFGEHLYLDLFGYLRLLQISSGTSVPMP